MKNFALIGIILMASVLLAQNKSQKDLYSGKLDMINYVKLSSDQKEIMYEIKLLEEDIEVAKQELDYAEKRIVELDQIAKLSAEFTDIRTKAIRKLKKSKELILFLKNDIEEYQFIENTLLYNIYNQQLQKKSLISKTKNKTALVRLKMEAGKFSSKAEQEIRHVYNDLSEAQVTSGLKEANSLYDRAIYRQRQAIVSCLKGEISDYFEDTDKLVVSSGDNQKSLIDIKNSVNKKLESFDPGNKAKRNIVFKIQLGAYSSNVDKSRYYELGLMTLYKKDSYYNKVLVGSYFSYRAAIKAREVIVKTTGYLDAFVVAYENGQRITIEEAINKGNNLLEKSAYMSFKNTNVE